MRFRLSNIKSKLGLILFSIVLLAGAIGMIVYIYSTKIQKQQNLKNQVNELAQIILETHQRENTFLLTETKTKRFLLNGETSSLLVRNRNKIIIHNLSEKISQNSLSSTLHLQDSITSFQNKYLDYQKTFYELSQKIRRAKVLREGLENYSKKIQNLDYIQSFALSPILRYETLYLKDQKLPENYQKSLDKDIQKFKKFHFRLDTIQLAELDLMFNKYSYYLEELLKVEELVNAKNGLFARTNHELINVSQSLILLKDSIHYKSEKWINTYSKVIMWAIIFLLFIAVLVAIWAVYFISHPIIKLESSSKSLRKLLKNPDVLNEIKGSSEIQNIAKNYQKTVKELKKNIHNSEKKQKLIENYEKQEKINQWQSQGFQIFNDIFLKQNTSTLQEQAQEIITSLVKYTNSNQGGLFVINEETKGAPYLELTGSYAYNKGKYKVEKIEYGEGLVGTAWREDEIVLMNDIPEDYAYTNTGLNQLRSNCLLIVPVKINGITQAMIELLAFHQYTEQEISFVEKISERIAGTLISVKATEKSKRLIIKSEQIAKEAQEREGELQSRLDNYEHWITQFEDKVNKMAEESEIYQAIVQGVFQGVIITDEQFSIITINNYITKHFAYKRKDLVGKMIDVLIETDYENIIDLKEKRFELSFKSFKQSVMGRLIDRTGRIYNVEVVAGRLEARDKIFYTFLFNEYNGNIKNFKSKAMKIKYSSAS